jgi:MYXO-CTERM domain-containing protein
MRVLHCRVVALGVATELLRGGAALACGASPIPYYVVAERAPSTAGTPLNAPVVVELKEDPSGPVLDTFNPSLTLTKARSDIAIELKSLGGRPTLVWVPVAALDAETEYEARLNLGYVGIPDATWTFTTGTKSTPPLSLEGELAVTLEPGSDTILECAGDRNLACGASEGCTDRVVAVTKARVKIPRAIAGFPPRFGNLRLTDGVPFDFSPASKTPSPDGGYDVSVEEYANLDDPSVTEMQITVPDRAVAYRPCFAFSAVDERGDRATSKPLCLEPIAPAANEGGAGAMPNPDDGLAANKPPSGTSEGCSVGPAKPNGSVWLVALGSFALVRRRRGRVGALSAARRP